MERRARLEVSFQLLEDTIIGSGYSVPGEEDIAVCKDSSGYPYMKGSTVKGLLRESMENLAEWMGVETEKLEAMLGAEDWNGNAEEHRIHLSDFCLKDKVAAEDCYEFRAFTSLEDGIAKEGSLRMAACVCSGLQFVGIVECDEEDVPIIEKAFKGIKWVGTLRNRGFGKVRFESRKMNKELKKTTIDEARCIHYVIKTKTPVIFTDLNKSENNSYQTGSVIPGSAIRGMVMNRIIQKNFKFFEENKETLLSEQTRFLDAIPTKGREGVIPSIKGFYAKKDGSDFQSVLLKDGELTPGVKRAKIGEFCCLEEGILHYFSTEKESVTRIKRKKETLDETEMFQQTYISKEQIFEGYILLENPKMSKVISECFEEDIWIGTDRYEGFGQCEIEKIETVDVPLWQKKYGYQKTDTAGKKLYMLSISPFTMTDGHGIPCGIQLDMLAEKLGVSKVEIKLCSTSVSEFCTYNRTWQCFSPTVRMYESGSIFKLECSEEPDINRILSLQHEGLGIRKEEGKGQILFLKPEIYENLKKTESMAEQKKPEDVLKAKIRRAKMQWIMEKDASDWKNGISKSQLGNIQALCEKAISDGGNKDDIEAFFKRNLTERGERHADGFRKVNELIKEVLEQPLFEILEIECEDSIIERLQLLCMLFDYQRKGREE